MCVWYMSEETSSSLCPGWVSQLCFSNFPVIVEDELNHHHVLIGILSWRIRSSIPFFSGLTENSFLTRPLASAVISSLDVLHYGNSTLSLHFRVWKIILDTEVWVVNWGCTQKIPWVSHLLSTWYEVPALVMLTEAADFGVWRPETSLILWCSRVRMFLNGSMRPHSISPCRCIISFEMRWSIDFSMHPVIFTFYVHLHQFRSFPGLWSLLA